MNFDQLLENENRLLEEEADGILSDIIDDYYTDEEGDIDVTGLSEDLEISLEETEELLEALVKRVNSKGRITKVKNRATRSRQATRTTKLSRSKLTRRARKAAKTRKRSPALVRKAIKKRNKANAFSG